MAVPATDDTTQPGEHAPTTTAGRIAAYREKVDQAVHAGSEKAVEKQHARGKMTAR